MKNKALLLLVEILVSQTPHLNQIRKMLLQEFHQAKKLLLGLHHEKN
jgi:hypothetical protein